jgi:predicted outer membrane protein
MSHRITGLGAATLLALAACGGETTAARYNQPRAPNNVPAPQTHIDGVNPGNDYDLSSYPLATTTLTSGTVRRDPDIETAPVNDAQIATLLDAALDGWIDQARLAVVKSSDGRVKRLASHVLTDDTGAQTNVRALEARDGLSPQDSPQHDTIADRNSRVMAQLASRAGVDLDREYVADQIDAHEKLLDAIDRILPEARYPDVKKLLQDERALASLHLREARQVQMAMTK